MSFFGIVFFVMVCSINHSFLSYKKNTGIEIVVTCATLDVSQTLQVWVQPTRRPWWSPYNKLRQH